jgi:hypothetical protein
MSDNTAVNNNADIRSKNAVDRQVWSAFKHFIKRLISRKSMEQLQAEIEINNRMKPALNWILLTGIGLGSIIGR